MKLKIRIKEKGGFFKKKRTKKVINTELTAGMYEVVALLEGEVKEKTPQGASGAEGGLRSTIYGEVADKGKEYVKGIIATQSKYGAVIEEGRSPGKAMPPPGVLISWIEKKLGLDEDEAKAIEFPMRVSIGKKGFEGVHMFAKAFDENLDTVVDIFERHGFNIKKALIYS